MDKNKLKTILVDQREEVKDILSDKSIINREVDVGQINKFLSHPNVVIISGVRRSGKSTLALKLLEEKNYFYINFDDERLVSFTSEDFDSLLQSGYELFGQNIKYFLFDEIQNIDNWQLFINRLRRTKRVIITGSNAELLSGELATHLTGRYLEVRLYPFSFREFLNFKDFSYWSEKVFSTTKKAEINNLFDEYIKMGGFPEVYKFGSAIVKQIYSDIINRDILLRYSVRKKKVFKSLANNLLSSFTNEISYRNMGRDFEIKDPHTVSNYVDYLVKTFLVFIVKKFSYKLRRQYLVKKKVYGIDTGMINAVSFQFSSNTGKLFENAVFVELLRRSSYSGKDSEVYFWQDQQGIEVDFVVKQGKKVDRLIQVSSEMKSKDVWEREVRGLVEASEHLRCDNLLILGGDDSKEIEKDGKLIKVIPLPLWLLNY